MMIERDHLGNIYKNKTEMCKAYGIPITTYRSRLANSWTLEEALTTPLKWRQKKEHSPRKGTSWKGIPCVDHLGNSYNSYTEMCKAYGISNVLFAKRKSRGFTLEQCLTPAYVYKDHKITTLAKYKISSNKDIYDMWDSEKNGYSIENHPNLNSTDNYYWKCNKGHSFYTKINSLIKKKNTQIEDISLCPICNYRKAFGKKVMCIETGKIYDSFREAGEDVEVPYSQIICYLNGKLKDPSKLKYTWKLVAH